MSIKTTILFDRPQMEIASLVSAKLSQSVATSIVTGFATPGGINAIAPPIKARPSSIATFIVGAATYPAFRALDDLCASGVPMNRLHVHLGHTRESGGRNNPIVRFHPMLHSKIYYMELPDAQACAFVGSHNVTSFALGGLNGEAAVLIEGPVSAPEFAQVRDHIRTARDQSLPYTPDMKESLAWWTREFLDGLKAEVKLPNDWITVRTILVFAQATKNDRPAPDDEVYFEIPEGIEQIDSLKTELHLFLFETLPADPWEALNRAKDADARYTGRVLGADNKQGNLELSTDWRIDGRKPPVLRRVPGKKFRPGTAAGLQQVRAEVTQRYVVPFEYKFDRERKEWQPEFSADQVIHSRLELMADQANQLAKDPDITSSGDGWKLVTRLVPRVAFGKEPDAQALALAAPESGHFILVSLRRRRADAASTDHEKR